MPYASNVQQGKGYSDADPWRPVTVVNPSSGTEPAASELPAGPLGPGVYIFRGPEGEALYVGKARSLRHRVLDHLRLQTDRDGYITTRSRQLEFLPTRNEREALLLEATLIRRLRPRYNVLLKDDKSFPYLSLTASDRFPRITFLRRPPRRTGTVLFGPYRSALEARQLARVLSESFQLRRCRALPRRACLYYHLKTCSAPCIGAISAEDYEERVRRAREVLEGKPTEALADLHRMMKGASAHQDYERAAVLRDALGALRDLEERQRVVDLGTERVDALALALPTRPGVLRAAVGVIKVREGNVVGGEPYLLTLPAEDPPAPGELLSTFLLQYYGESRDLPQRVYLPGDLSGVEGARETLSDIRGLRVDVAQAGRRRSLVELAERMARAHLDARSGPPTPGPVLLALRNRLELPRLPHRIEGVDISLFQGSHAVGSLVVFVDAAPAKEEYRRFRIKTVEGTDDFAMVHEVVSRRFRRRLQEGRSLPDLLLIDGGAGQVASALRALEELGIGDLPLVGLAKQREELYRPRLREPLRPDRNAPDLLLLRHVRDEAHRFAVGYHRTRRRMALRSEEDAGPVPLGEGP
ncbi:Excinuclease ABC subunit C [mine drainage metagenome]|uniref:Excinuclease ABC subunit C n=2 Tax=mine drainage metagenome TaxID=410659 RepID=T1A3C3_9ZZZZ